MAGSLKQDLSVKDLVALSVSSVGPLFSIAATGGVMAANSGIYTILAIVLIAIPFVIASFVFRLLNRHFPHAGASYHWSARVIGIRASRFQAWILILAYFASIPPIIIPAANYTLTLLFPSLRPNSLEEVGASLFWVLFALFPLLKGARPTARLTQVFLVIELVAVAVIVGLAISRWNAIHVPVHFGPLPIGGMIVTAVVAATILDGWEIDSYASEEAERPKSDPGIGGIIGAFIALGFYALIYPLMFGETPLHLLSGAANPMATWGARLVPGKPWLVLIPVLASTAGGLWLTSFILIRALYAMGREKLLPTALSKVNRSGAPNVATYVTLGAATLVVMLQVFFHSLSSFFALVLSSAGFFLVVEFFLDSVTATIFLRRAHRTTIEEGKPHAHRVLYLFSAIASLLFGAFMVSFVFVAPKAISASVDYIIAVLIVAGFAFSRYSKRHDTIFNFHGKDRAETDSLIETI